MTEGHDDIASGGQIRVIEREFGGRLTPAEQQAVADALAGFWHDDQESPAATG